FVMYGQTEATARISCLPPDRLGEKLGSAGLPLDNLLIRIVDEMGLEVLTGQTGEIQVRGPSVCSGYLDDAEATQRKFDGGWLKTGDFGCRDDEGYLWIQGRTGEFIQIRGVRVSLGDVEALLAASIYGLAPEQRCCTLLALLKQELAYACDRNSRLRNYVQHWPVDFRAATRIADLPYLPAGVFKANPPLSLVDAKEIKRTLT